MARKKKTEEVEPEVIVEETVATETPVEDAVAETPAEDVVVEETPVEDKPKTTRKKKTTKKVETVAEEPEEKVEEVTVPETPVVEEIQPEPEKAEAEQIVVDVVEETPVVIETPTTDMFEPYKAIVKVGSLNVRVGPGINYNRVRDIYKNAKITILEEDGNWGRIGKDLWVNINYIEKI